MNENFQSVLLRLKEQARTPADKDIAELLGLSEKALNARKARGSFPEDKLFSLVARRPELNIDPNYVLKGIRYPVNNFIAEAEKVDKGGHIARRFHAMRAALGLSVADMAARLGWTQEQVESLEAGKEPSAADFVSLQQALGLLAYYVRDGDGELLSDITVIGQPFKVEMKFNQGHVVYHVSRADAAPQRQFVLQPDEELLLDNYRSSELAIRKRAQALLLGVPEALPGNLAPKVHQNFGNAQIGQVAGDIQAPQTFTFHGKEPSDRTETNPKKGKA